MKHRVASAPGCKHLLLANHTPQRSFLKRALAASGNCGTHQAKHLFHFPGLQFDAVGWHLAGQPTTANDAISNVFQSADSWGKKLTYALWGSVVAESDATVFIFEFSDGMLDVTFHWQSSLPPSGKVPRHHRSRIGSIPSLTKPWTPPSTTSEVSDQLQKLPTRHEEHSTQGRLYRRAFECHSDARSSLATIMRHICHGLGTFHLMIATQGQASPVVAGFLFQAAERRTVR